MKHPDYAFIAMKFRREHPFCQMEGCTKPGESVHHKMGRDGYADEWARENNIPLVIDPRFFATLCIDCHNKVENNPEWAYKEGYSIPRSGTNINKK